MARDKRTRGRRGGKSDEPVRGWATYAGPEGTVVSGTEQSPAVERKQNDGESAKPPRESRSADLRGAGYLTIIKRAFKDFSQDECPRMAAAISYYTLFSMPPLLVLILMLTGLFVDSALVEQRIQTEMSSVLGSSGAAQVQEMIGAARRPGEGGVGATILSVAALLFGATGAFMELQKALNRAWEVQPDPRSKGGIVRLIVKRLLSLGMVATIGFLLLVSLIASAAVSAFGDRMGAMLPGGISAVLLQGLQMVLSLAVVAVLFALMFKLLPDARSSWKDVCIGALITALLFTAGKFGIGLYLARSDPGKAFGAAGSLALILVWVYYSSMMVFLGAEFTQVRAVARGDGIEPEKGAVKVLERPKEAEKRAKREARGEAPEPPNGDGSRRWANRARDERTRPPK